MSKLSNMLINEQFKTVLFDVDGTLFDTLPSLSAANNLVLKQAGLLEVATPLLRPALNEGLRAMFRKSIDLQMVPVDDELVMVLEKEFLQQYMQDWLAAATVYPHLHEALAALKKLGLKLGICTNRDRASTEYLLAQSRIAEFFELIVGLGDAPHALAEYDSNGSALHESEPEFALHQGLPKTDVLTQERLIEAEVGDHFSARLGVKAFRHQKVDWISGHPCCQKNCCRYDPKSQQHAAEPCT